MKTNHKFPGIVIPGETPTKGFEVVVQEHSGTEQVLQWTSDLPALLPVYKEAVQQAKESQKEDGKTRFVLIRQILVRETV